MFISRDKRYRGLAIHSEPYRERDRRRNRSSAEGKNFPPSRTGGIGERYYVGIHHCETSGRRMRYHPCRLLLLSDGTYAEPDGLSLVVRSAKLRSPFDFPKTGVTLVCLKVTRGLDEGPNVMRGPAALGPHEAGCENDQNCREIPHLLTFRVRGILERPSCELSRNVRSTTLGRGRVSPMLILEVLIPGTSRAQSVQNCAPR